MRRKKNRSWNFGSADPNFFGATPHESVPFLISDLHDTFRMNIRAAFARFLIPSFSAFLHGEEPEPAKI